MKWLVILCMTVTCFYFSMTLKVGVYHNPPLIDFSENKAAGLYAEILQKISSQNNWDIEYVFGEFATLLEKLKAKQLDLVVAVAYTQSRAELFDFNNQAVILNWGVICVKGTLKGLLDLQDKVIAVVESDVYAQYLRKQLEDFKMNVRYFYVSDYEKALEAVQNGLADACVVSRIFAQNNAARYMLQISGIVFSPVELRFALAKNADKNQMIIQAIDDYLYKIKSDQQGYNQLLARYLGQYVEKNVIPGWLKTVLILIVVATGLFILWTVSLRKIVAMRTDQLNKALGELTVKNEELIAADQEIRAQNEELQAMNEELEKTIKDLETAIERFNESMNLIGQLAVFEKDEEFCWDFLTVVRTIVPDCSVAFSYMNMCYLQTKKGINVALTERSVNESFQIYDFDEKVHETLNIGSDKEYIVIFNHSEHKLEDKVVRLVKSLFNIAKVFLRIRAYQAKERDFVKRINEVLLTILNYHESYTFVHSTRSSDYAVKVAQRMFLDDESISRVYWATLIHDIGKIAVPREILCKSSKLSPEEFEKVKIHPVVAADLLEKAGLNDIAKIVRHHHERYDGTGYPDGLRAEQIPIESRIISVVDAYDAMTSDRPYRKALSCEKAVEELEKNAGSQFDPLIVKIFIELLKESHEE